MGDPYWMNHWAQDEPVKRAWYLGICTTRQIVPIPGMDKERGEFAAERQLHEMGIEAFVPKKIEFIRQGKRRYADAVETPYMPGYVFANLSPEEFYKALDTRGMSRTLMALTAHDLHGAPEYINKTTGKKVKAKIGVLGFRERALVEEAKARRIMASNDRAAMVQYEPGDLMDIIDGPFMERAARFVRMVESASHHPMVEAETEVFGRQTRIQIDPLDLKAKVG